MYAPFFGLSKEPFSIAPDPRFLYMSGQHREALAHLLYGLGGGGGFVLLTGEIGAGKTTVCRCFLEQVPAECAVAYVFNPKLTATELLQTVCGEFGIPLPAEAFSVKAHVDALNAFLLAAHAQGRKAVLVIDEAQSLSADVLEQLRLLTNLETAERKLLQIVLIGQPELRDMLDRPELKQLGQRVIARYHLGPLSFVETQEYIRHRLAVAGPSAPLPFSKSALALIHKISGGVPRRINLLADRSLLGAYSQGNQRAERATVSQAAREVFGRAGATPRWPWVAAAALLLVAGVGFGIWQWGQPGARVNGSMAVASAPSGAAPSVPALAASAGGSGPAGGTAAALPPPDPAPADPAELLAVAHAQQSTAWRELALRWNVAIGEGDPCAAAEQAQMGCFRSTGGGLPIVRALGRPGVVTLRPNSAPPVYAVLVSLDDRQAQLQAASRRFNLTLPQLATIWRGEYATYWRTPPGWREGVDATVDPAGRAWISRQLTTAGLPEGRPLFERVWSFQLAQGLPPDGLAGPMTLMRMNRTAGIDEPRLMAER